MLIDRPAGNVVPPRPPTPPPPPKKDTPPPDRFETAAPASTFDTSQMCPVLPPSSGLSPAEIESAQQTIALASDGNDATPLVNWLADHATPSSRDQMMDMLFDFGPVAGSVLNDTGRLGDADKALLSQSLDHAWRSGAVTAEELQAAVVTTGYGALPGETHVGLSETVAGTGNPELIETYALREMQILKTSPDEEAFRSQAVVSALSGLAPQPLQAFLGSHLEDVKTAIGFTDVDYDAVSRSGLGSLLDAASAIVPSTPESIAVFKSAIPMIGENPESRRGSAAFFERHMDAVLQSFQADSAKLTIDGQQQMSIFFARTLFSPPAYEGQDTFRESLLKRMASLGNSLDRYALANPPPIAAQRDAQLLGSLVGTVEGGFHIAVDELDARNEAVEGMVDLVFKAKDLLPSAELPGFGILKSLAVDKIKEWVVDSLKERPRDASEAIPFHALIGERIDSVALTTIYDAARSEAFTNRGVGLVK